MVNYSYVVLSGNASSDELTDSEKSLIKKFGYGENYVKRWPDGIVYVYNGTTYKGLPKIIKTIYQIIGDKTIFQLSKDKKTSNVVSIYKLGLPVNLIYLPFHKKNVLNYNMGRQILVFI